MAPHSRMPTKYTYAAIGFWISLTLQSTFVELLNDYQSAFPKVHLGRYEDGTFYIYFM